MLRAVSGAGFIDYSALFQQHHGGPRTKCYEGEGGGPDEGGSIDVYPQESISSYSMSSSSSSSSSSSVVKNEYPPSEDEDIPIHMEICSGIPHNQLPHNQSHVTSYSFYQQLLCPSIIYALTFPDVSFLL